MKHSLLHRALAAYCGAALLWFAAGVSASAQSKARPDYINDKGDPAAIARFACPANTILSGPYDMNVESESGGRVYWTHNGQVPSDQELSYQPLIPGMSSQDPIKCYRAFSNNQYRIQGVRFYGCWGYMDPMALTYVPSTTRGGIDADGNMTQTQNFEISFYQMDHNGMPSTEVYKEVVALKGDNTGVSGTCGPYYAFTYTLKQPVNLEEGFISISATNNGGPFTDGWFLLLANGAAGGYYVLENVKTHVIDPPKSGNGIFPVYCLLGSKDEPLAQHALKLMNIVNPAPTEGGKQAKVTVEVMNVGAKPMSDATLELYRDGQLVATEKVDRTIAPGEGYTYTFAARVDCSDNYHIIKVKNVTPGDEGIAAAELIREVDPTDQASKSASNDPLAITRVTVGDQINKSSGAKPYSDFTSEKATIKPGEKLAVNVTVAGSDYKHYNKLWVDWNGNGSFADKGDFVGYSTNGQFELSVPTGVEVTPGDHRMRLMVSYDDSPVVGTYAIGETEDYTLTVERPANGPALELTPSEYIAGQPGGTQAMNSEIALTNKGNQPLTTNWRLAYTVPQAPNAYFGDSRTFPLAETPAAAPLKAALVPATEAAQAPAADADAFTFTYAGEFNNHTIKLSGSSNPMTFAHLYPAEMLQHLKGMKLSSVDVYVGQQTSGKVIVYGQGANQQTPGEQLVAQDVTLKPNQWNTLTLADPVTVDGTDLWVGLQPGNKSESQIGMDAGPATKGFSDLLLSDGKWYQISTMGLDANTCIRSSFTGQRTPAIDWLSLSQTSLNLGAGESGKLTLSVNTDKLDPNTVYEAVALGTTNDPVRSLVKVPVYLRPAGTSTGIADATVGGASDSSIRLVEGYTVETTGDKAVDRLTAYRVNGSVAAQVFGQSHLSLRGLGSGVYLVEVYYADGSRETATFSLRSVRR